MDSFALISSVMKRISPLKLLDVIAILSLPIWLLYKIFPDLIIEVIYYLPVDNIPLWVSNLLMLILKLCVALSVICILGIILLRITSLIQETLRRLFGSLLENGDSYRDLFLKMLTRTYIRMILYITAITTYSQIFLNNSKPITFLYASNSYWITLFPVKIFICLSIILLIIP